MKKDLKWFYDRIGKKVFQSSVACPCDICREKLTKGVEVEGRFHAKHLWSHQNLFNIVFADKRFKQ